MPRRRPKKIVTWRYDDGAGTTMEIPVYQVIEATTGSGSGSTSLSSRIREECSDVNVLREKVFTAIKGQLVISLGAFSPDQRRVHSLEPGGFPGDDAQESRA